MRSGVARHGQARIYGNHGQENDGMFYKQTKSQASKYNMTWDVAKARNLMNNMFNKEKIMGMVFNPNNENMAIVFKELLLSIMPGEKPKPKFYRE